jgi:hypothetical protein
MAMAWARFSFAVAAPLLILGSARRFKAAFLAAFVCCSRRRRSVSPPEEPQAVRAGKQESLDEFSETERDGF